MAGIHRASPAAAAAAAAAAATPPIPCRMFSFNGTQVRVVAGTRPGLQPDAPGDGAWPWQLLMAPGLFARLAAGAPGPLFLAVGGLVLWARPDPRTTGGSVLLGHDVAALGPGEGPVLEARRFEPVELLAACLTVSMPRGAEPRRIPLAALDAQRLLVGRTQGLAISEILRLAIEGRSAVELAAVELRAADGRAVPTGMVTPATTVTLVAGPGVQLPGAPVTVALSVGRPRPGDADSAPYPRHVTLTSMYQAPHDLDVLLAPAGEAVARALARSAPAGGPFYVRHQDRVLEVRICPRPTVPGIALRASVRVAASLGSGSDGRPVALDVCEAPPAVAVAWLETDVALCPARRAHMVAELIGAPLTAGQIFRWAPSDALVRVVRLMDRDFRGIGAGQAGAFAAETVLFMQTASGPGEQPHHLVVVPEAPAGERALLLASVPMDRAPGTLLVSEAAFSRLAGPGRAHHRAIPFICQGGLLNVRCV
ncbi:hypothetical protein H696_06123 [Fonticula alba]|uniref:Uncharacterized protein n=1 Tax=Fonticula alba TaxID=691883 RepID=A0A058YZY8_FONAL|nr:hypothetical protein H696_06123 [Fonticula alba]KCV67431.1 hypothetical protein H696_06123 [Fonticula alba]|eukprot:XP_009498158.1 hypothetical protein H696_06123 [Fonticula alba]